MQLYKELKTISETGNTKNCFKKIKLRGGYDPLD